LNGGGAASAEITDCTGTFTLGVGGFAVSAAGTGQDSAYIPSDQRVGYNSIDINAGAAELDRLFWLHRDACPADHIKIIGHSGGAAVAHVWVSRNKYEQNANAILLADPKRAAGPGGDGLAGNPFAGALGLVGVFSGAAGTDADFGSFPVLTVCNAGDWVCNEDAGPDGYLFSGVHGKYDVNPWDYGDWDSGVVWNEIY
jgi:cutinase